MTDNSTEQQRIEAGNKLIAEFMGYKLIDCHSPFLGKQWRNENIKNPLYSVLESNEENQLSFHKNWNWLMPVVEKISKHQYPDFGNCEPFQDYAYPRTFGMPDSEGKPMFRFNASTLFTADTLIGVCWLAVVDWIEFYNEQSSKGGGE